MGDEAVTVKSKQGNTANIINSSTNKNTAIIVRPEVSKTDVNVKAKAEPNVPRVAQVPLTTGSKKLTNNNEFFIKKYSGNKKMTEKDAYLIMGGNQQSQKKIPNYINQLFHTAIRR